MTLWDQQVLSWWRWRLKVQECQKISLRPASQLWLGNTDLECEMVNEPLYWRHLGLLFNLWFVHIEKSPTWLPSKNCGPSLSSVRSSLKSYWLPQDIPSTCKRMFIEIDISEVMIGDLTLLHAAWPDNRRSLSASHPSPTDLYDCHFRVDIHPAHGFCLIFR